MPRKLKSVEHYALAKAWSENIEKALKHRLRFKAQYRDAQRFAFDSHGFIFEDLTGLEMQTTVPKAWEMLSIFGPLLAFKEPKRTSRVRFPRPGENGRDPREAFTRVSQDLLNYAADELKLKAEAREAVDESILAAGIMWLELDPVTNLIGHFAGSILDFLVDPDAEVLRDAWWIARRRMMPRWEAAELLDVDIESTDLPRGDQKSIVDMELHTESDRNSMTGEMHDESAGKTNELLEVWEIWSKMGIGFRSKALGERYSTIAQGSKDEADYGDEVHFYVVKNGKRLFKVRDDWPVPLYLDNSWPCSILFYKKQRRYIWPVSVMAPALGLQKAIDWMATMILTKIRTTSRDFIAVLKGLDEDIEEKIRSGNDLELLRISSGDLGDGKSVQDLISFLKHSPMNTDIWRVWELLVDLFEKASGLYAALYGEQGRTQARSAEEIKDRRNRSDLRPQDMAERVADWHSEMARKEMIAARIHYEPEFVAEILGEEAGEVWGQYQEGDLVSENGGLGRVMREYDYRIEAGSTARPDVNKERDDALEVFDRAMQTAFNVQDVEAMNKLLENLQVGMGIPEDKRVSVRAPEPPKPPPDPTVEIKLAIEKVKLRIEEIKLQQEEARLAEAQAKAGIAAGEAEEAGAPSPPEQLGEAMLESAGGKDVVAIRDGLPVTREELPIGA